MGRDERVNRENRLTVLDSVRGHDSSVAHAWDHTGGTCPKCGNKELFHAFCTGPAVTDPPLPRIRGCEMDGEHVHRMCGACKYPWIERPLDQAMLAEQRGEIAAESELAAALAAIIVQMGGVQLELRAVYAQRGAVIHFFRDKEHGRISLAVTPKPTDEGRPAHLTAEMMDEGAQR